MKLKTKFIATMKTEQFSVGKMKCMGCVATITSGLSEIEGVSKVNAELESATVTVTYENDSLREVIINKLEALGYPVNLDIKQGS